MLSLLSIAMLYMIPEEPSSAKLLQVICLEVVSPTMIFMFFMIFAARYQRLIDFFGAGILVPFIIVGYIFQLTPSMQLDGDRPNFQIYMFVLMYTTYLFFLNTDFMLTLIVR